MALAVTLTAGIFAEQQNRKLHQQSVRAEVNEQLGLVRARLEGNINANLQLARGLVAVISARPDIDQAQFAAIARQMVGSHSQIRNLAAAPDLVVELMYPVEGNERAIAYYGKRGFTDTGRRKELIHRTGPTGVAEWCLLRP